MKRLLLVLFLCLVALPAFGQSRIIFTRSNGEITVRNLLPGAMAQDFTNAIQHAIDSGKAVDTPVVVDQTDIPADRIFRNAWRRSGGTVLVDMPLARDIHAGRIATAQVAEIARLKVEERKERLKGNMVKANAHAATVTALEALDLNVLAMQIANAPNPIALSAIWPANIPR